MASVQALDIMQETKPNLLILNFRLPTMTGLELYDKAIRQWGEIPAIMLSANLPRHVVARRSIIGMHKPFELDEFLDLIDRLLAKKAS